MFKRFFRTDLASQPNDASINQSRSPSTVRKAISDWRFSNDVAAIVVALDRLPDHRLRMIGLNRDGLFDAVFDMILSAEEDRAIGREVIAILDASADSTFNCQDMTPPKGIPKQTETAAKGG
ncbi:MAG: hypothetical protein ACJAXK_001602 [Yoonia sp.]|jgi:hypothetical protein